MIKLFFHLLILLFLTNCSVDKSAKKISDIDFTSDLSFDQFKKNVIEYGKLSDYPKLDE